MMPSSSMPFGTILAGVPAEGLIYFVVLFFWVISRIAKLRRKGQEPASPAPQTGPRPVDQELKELFETITGQKLPPTQSPPPVLQTPAPPRRLPQTQRPAHTPTRAPRPKPVATRTPPPLVPTPAYTVAQAAAAGSGSLVQAGGAAVATRSTVVAAIPIALPAMKMGFTSSTGSHLAAQLLADLRSKEGLRAAIAQRVVLGPPRAFDPA